MRAVVVEDDRDLRDALVRVMRLLGYEVVEADQLESVEAGLRALSRRPAPDALLVDVLLPSRTSANGVDLARAARLSGCCEGTAIVVVSGAFGPDSVEAHRVRGSGAIFLPKPVNIGALDQALFAARESAAEWSPTEAQVIAMNIYRAAIHSASSAA